MIGIKNTYYEEGSPINSYQLTSEQLNEIHLKYGQPGEISPGQKARKRRKNIDIMSRRGNQRNKKTE